MTNNQSSISITKETYTPIKLSANGIVVEIDKEILDIMGIDPSFMNIEIHRSTREELSLF